MEDEEGFGKHGEEAAERESYCSSHITLFRRDEFGDNMAIEDYHYGACHITSD